LNKWESLKRVCGKITKTYLTGLSVTGKLKEKGNRKREGEASRRRFGEINPHIPGNSVGVFTKEVT